MHKINKRKLLLLLTLIGLGVVLLGLSNHFFRELIFAERKSLSELKENYSDSYTFKYCENGDIMLSPKPGVMDAGGVTYNQSGYLLYVVAPDGVRTTARYKLRKWFGNEVSCKIKG